ncbi:MAG: DUF1223 domain-containing protein [Pseudomonadota bacterium]
MTRFPLLLMTALAATLTFSGSALAAECAAQSGKQTNALIELYTSEGCSSCPPADRWLSGLLRDSGNIVPLAFHVDYWDYIGWKDRFAQARFADRQRQISQLAGGRFVYTPQVMLNGRDYRGWQSSRFVADVAAINQVPARARIELRLTTSPGAMDLVANANSTQTGAVFYIALYENQLSSDVKAGENSGARLLHDYVVREWLGPYPVGESRQLRIALKLDWQPASLGLAAVVQTPGKGEVLQALALKYCGAPVVPDRR